MTQEDETFTEIIKGHCLCGEKVELIKNSNITKYTNGDRFVYPEDNSRWTIFRCRKCSRVISDSFMGETRCQA